MFLYLDIETIPSQRPGAREEIAANLKPPASYKKAETIEAWERDEKPALVEEAYRKTSIDGASGHVISIACAIDGGPARPLNSIRCERPGAVLHYDEELDVEGGVFTYDEFLDLERMRLLISFQGMTDQLQAAANAASKHPAGPGHGYVYVREGEIRDCQAAIGPVTVVAHHAEFDLRFLYHRAVILGVPVPAWFPVNQRPNVGGDVFAGPRVFDTMTYWAGYNGRIGQDRLCAALGIERSDDIGGNEVYDRWLAGDGDAIWQHNKADVERLRRIHRRLTFWTPPPGLIKAPPGAKPAKLTGAR